MSSSISGLRLGKIICNCPTSGVCNDEIHRVFEPTERLVGQIRLEEGGDREFESRRRRSGSVPSSNPVSDRRCRFVSSWPELEYTWTKIDSLVKTLRPTVETGFDDASR